MNRRRLLQTALGVGFGGFPADIEYPFYEWEREEFEWGTHYWRRDKKTCYEYKDYETTRILSIYTIHEVGELDEYLIKTEVESPREAIQMIERINALIK